MGGKNLICKYNSHVRLKLVTEVFGTISSFDYVASVKGRLVKNELKRTRNKVSTKYSYRISLGLLRTKMELDMQRM